MIRIFKDTAFHLYMLYIWVRHVNGVSLNQAVGEAARWLTENNEVLKEHEKMMLMKFDQATSNEATSVGINRLNEVESQISLMARSIVEPSSRNWPDLIDTIVDVVKLPYAKGIMQSKKFIEYLRSALLTEEEMEKLKISAGRLHCFQCGSQFTGMELATVQIKPQDFIYPMILCANCVTPTSIAAPDGQKIQLSRRQLNALAPDRQEPPKPDSKIKWSPYTTASSGAITMEMLNQVAHQRFQRAAPANVANVLYRTREMMEMQGEVDGPFTLRGDDDTR